MIHSFAHGRTIYELRYDAAHVRKAMEAADKGEVVATYALYVAAADIDAMEQAELRQLAKKLTPIGVGSALPGQSRFPLRLAKRANLLAIRR